MISAISRIPQKTRPLGLGFMFLAINLLQGFPELLHEGFLGDANSSDLRSRTERPRLREGLGGLEGENVSHGVDCSGGLRPCQSYVRNGE